MTDAVSRHALVCAAGKRVSVAVSPDALAGGAFAAQRIADVLHSVSGRAPVLGLATGRSVAPIYAALVEVFRRHELDARQLVTFNLDEYVGIPSDHPASFRCFMHAHLFDPAGIPASSCHFPDAHESDGNDGFERFERAIRAAGGIDLQLLGIGVNGHVAFNEPGSDPSSRTRRVALASATLAENAPSFAGLGPMPREAVTMGIATILETRRVLLVAWGRAKAEPLRRAFHGAVSPECPASFLQLHPGPVELVVDREAARELVLADEGGT